MKKLFLICFVGLLAACNHTVKPENNSDKLVLVDAAPQNCVYLYKMDADAEFYSHDDAIQYLRNRIAMQAQGGNVFWLERDEKQQKPWVMFGPEYKYSLTARVYNCAAHE